MNISNAIRAICIAAASLHGVAAAQSDPVFFNQVAETATRYNPGVDSTAYQNVYVYAPGASQARINSISVGIGRGDNAPAVDVNISINQMLWDGTAYTLGPLVASKSASLPAVTAGTTSVATVSWGDADPALRPVVNLMNNVNGMNGYGAFWVGVKFRGTNAANALNGWRVALLPTTGRSMNNFALANSATGAWASNYWFGQATGTDGTTLRDRPARFHLSVRGAAINPVTPPADMLYGHSCADLGGYHMPQAPDGLATRWAYANLFIGANGGQEFTPRRINVGIARNGTAAAPAPAVNLELALVQMNWSGTAFSPGQVIATATFPLAEVSTLVRETVSWDFAAGSAPRVPLETASNQGLGGLYVAARFSGPNAADTKNLWRICYLQQRGASTNRFGMNDANGVFVGGYFFGNYDNGAGEAGEEKPARLLAEAFGTVADPAAACLGDLDLDGSVTGADLGLLLGAWGPCGAVPCLGDLDLDGSVTGADLGLLLGAWGACP
jgi:hypothetical protein